jgi:micrococcal nuclease
MMPSMSVKTTMGSKRLLGIVFTSFFLTVGLSAAQPLYAQEIYYLSNYDGDTVTALDAKTHKKLKIRLIGIDTPEMKQGEMGRRAKVFLQQLLKRSPENAHFTLELDVQHHDRYYRVLGYLLDGDRLINLEMVKNGYAYCYTIPPNVKYQKQLLAAQQYAQKNQLGLWAPEHLHDERPADFRHHQRHRSH